MCPTLQLVPCGYGWTDKLSEAQLPRYRIDARECRHVRKMTKQSVACRQGRGGNKEVQGKVLPDLDAVQWFVLGAWE